MKAGHIRGANEKHAFPTIEDIFNARDLLNKAVRKTPLQRSDTFSKLTGTNIFLKLESLQKTGSFKVRGAFVKLDMLSNEERKYGVIVCLGRQSCPGSCICCIEKKIFHVL